MSKVMIVEDDDSLREIYGIRLAAEGYTVVSAHDGEEALAVAVKERPDLIVSDVMMPKISGFDMLDILRSTPETANIKVIMMTALSSDDQRDRGENLGADRYLVKSQVGIEDVINVVHDVLGDRNATTGPNSTPTIEAAPAQPSTPATGSGTPAAAPATFAIPPQPAQPVTPPTTQPTFDPTSFNIPHATPESAPAAPQTAPSDTSTPIPDSIIPPVA